MNRRRPWWNTSPSGTPSTLLPERERQTILLRFFKCLTQEQTARILGRLAGAGIPAGAPQPAEAAGISVRLSPLGDGLVYMTRAWNRGDQRERGKSGGIRGGKRGGNQGGGTARRRCGGPSLFLRSPLKAQSCASLSAQGLPVARSSPRPLSGSASPTPYRSFSYSSGRNSVIVPLYRFGRNVF